MAKREIPLVDLYLDMEDMEDGMNAISLVDFPAIEMNWQTFNKDTNYFKFELEEEERIIHSPIMLADTPIYRVSPVYGEYFVKFSPDTIKKMMIKYFKENKIHQVNEMHNSKRKVDNIFMVESYIVGERNQSLIFKDIPKGSWVVSFYVQDKEYWEKEVKSGNLKGLSLEGYFDEDWENSTINSIYSKMEKIVFSEEITDVEKEKLIRKLINF